VDSEQADMWDLDGKTPDHIAGYKRFIDSIAAHARVRQAGAAVQRRLAPVPCRFASYAEERRYGNVRRHGRTLGARSTVNGSADAPAHFRSRLRGC
jgi:hypothetical protein